MFIIISGLVVLSTFFNFAEGNHIIEFVGNQGNGYLGRNNPNSLPSRVLNHPEKFQLFEVIEEGRNDGSTAVGSSSSEDDYETDEEAVDDIATGSQTDDSNSYMDDMETVSDSNDSFNASDKDKLNLMPLSNGVIEVAAHTVIDKKSGSAGFLIPQSALTNIPAGSVISLVSNSQTFDQSEEGHVGDESDGHISAGDQDSRNYLALPSGSHPGALMNDFESKLENSVRGKASNNVPKRYRQKVHRNVPGRANNKRAGCRVVVNRGSSKSTTNAKKRRNNIRVIQIPLNGRRFESFYQ